MTQPNAANKATSRRFRHATMRDLPHMQKIYARARELMAANGNPTQWGNEFPRESVIEDDIANQRTVLLVDTCNGHERILAQFALCPGEDPTYASPQQQGYAACAGEFRLRPMRPDSID